MPLITLKVFTQISRLSAKVGYNSTKMCIESVIGKIADMADISEETSLFIVHELEQKLAQQIKDKTYKAPEAVHYHPQKGKVIGINSLKGKPSKKDKKEKKVIMIE